MRGRDESANNERKNVKGCNPCVLKKINCPAGHSIVNGTSPPGWQERFITHFPGETSVTSPYKGWTIMRV